MQAGLCYCLIWSRRHQSTLYEVSSVCPSQSQAGPYCLRSKQIDDMGRGWHLRPTPQQVSGFLRFRLQCIVCESKRCCLVISVVILESPLYFTLTCRVILDFPASKTLNYSLGGNEPKKGMRLWVEKHNEKLCQLENNFTCSCDWCLWLTRCTRTLNKLDGCACKGIGYQAVMLLWWQNCILSHLHQLWWYFNFIWLWFTNSSCNTIVLAFDGR